MVKEINDKRISLHFIASSETSTTLVTQYSTIKLLSCDLIN